MSFRRSTNNRREKRGHIAGDEVPQIETTIAYIGELRNYQTALPDPNPNPNVDVWDGYDI